MQVINKKAILKRLGEALQGMIIHLRKHMGQIAYYACIALVLTAVAVAAERWRGENEEADALVLPAVELAAPVQREPDPIFEVPEKMAVLKGYAGHPEWNSVHNQWETHTAVDYACADGQVLSLSDGVVRTVGRSGVYGGFVEIETQDYLLRYASVEPEEKLEPGAHIKKGEQLGLADESMPGEAFQGAHLHLELIQSGAYLDFQQEASKKVAAVD